MNAFSIKGANMGKIINLVSGDFNLLEYHLVLVYGLFTIPISLIFASIILCVRFKLFNSLRSDSMVQSD